MVRGILGIALVAFCAAAIAQDALLNRARQFIQAKQYKEAYALLEPQEQARAGEPEYDYLLGIAAIDAGQLTRGVFALERVLAVNPNHPQARAEIARAYFLMGENRLARSEFQSVKGSRPPAEVSATVDRFLDALDSRERSRHTGVNAYVEFGLGHDTNVNAATSASSVAIPSPTGPVPFTLTAGSNRQDDQYWALNAGVGGRLGVTDSIGVVGSASIEQKRNFDLDRFDTGAINGSLGLSHRQGPTEWVLAFQAQRFDVENNRFRDAKGGVLQYRTSVSTNDQVTVYGQYSRLNYPGQPDRNTDRSVLGGAWAHAYGGLAGSPVTFASAYFGKEDTREANVPHFGHDLYGARVGGQMGLSDHWTLTASASFEHRRYQGPDPTFGVERDDKDMQLRIGAIYQHDRNWSLTPAVQLTKVKSNVVINDYSRAMLSVLARYDFR